MEALTVTSVVVCACAFVLDLAWATPVNQVSPKLEAVSVFSNQSSVDVSQQGFQQSPSEASQRDAVNVSASYAVVQVGGSKKHLSFEMESKDAGVPLRAQRSEIMEHRSLPSEDPTEDLDEPPSSMDNMATPTKHQPNLYSPPSAFFESKTPGIADYNVQGRPSFQDEIFRRIGKIPYRRKIISLPDNPRFPAKAPSRLSEEQMLRRAGFGAPIPFPEKNQQPVVYRTPILGVFGKRTDRNILDPIFRFIYATVIIILFFWLFSFIQTYAMLPTRFFFGIKFEAILRYLARLILYMGQIFVNNLQSNPFLGGSFQVPAKGIQISKAPEGNVPGFTLDVPATTISYSYNLSAELATKLQALIDAFNEVLNIQGGPAAIGGSGGGGDGSSGGASERSGDFDDPSARLDKLLGIAEEIREVAGGKCDDNPLATRGKQEKELCKNVNHVVQYAESLRPSQEEVMEKPA